VVSVETRVRQELPHLTEAEKADLARVVETIVRRFVPDSVYVFGSQARGEAGGDSDVDLLIVVPDAGEYPHHLAQAAYGEVGRHLLPLDLVFVSRDEFAWRSRSVTSLAATVLREGRPLYAAA
jgi:predicted nucleotidyltransferase